jgi:serine protease Do
MRNSLLFLCLIIVVLFSDCSGCSKSGRDRQRNESKNSNYTAQETPERGRKKPRTDKNETDDNYKLPKKGSENRPKLSIMEIVKQAEPAVFLVNTFNNGRGISMGTGFFIENSGIGVSNFHVFDGGDEWTIQTSDQKQYEVIDIIESSEEFDYIIFQVEKRKQFPKLEIATIRPEKGEDIIVLGNPKGLESTLTRGIISSIRDIIENDKALLQIDAAISPGSSGSPVMNMKGEVVGIATMKILECENCNFAMSIKVLD